MSDLHLIDRLLAAATAGDVPSDWAVARRRIVADYQTLNSLVETGQSGYGVTTAVGHRDREGLSDVGAFQTDLLDSHALPGIVWSTTFQSRCISVAKAQQLSQGGTGCAPEVYDAVCTAAVDPDFAPRVPLDAPYSSGDVICGAWWAKGLLEVRGGLLGSKGALSLVNGSFVHAGAALALVSTLRAAIRSLESFASGVLIAGRAKENPFDDDPERRSRIGQDPVAIRATRDVLATVRDAHARLEASLGSALSVPSDNPLIVNDRFVEQASFLAPRLAVAVSGAVDAWMLAATWIERAIMWLCTGAGGLRGDLADEGRLGLIQVPKLAVAHAHRLRDVLAPRPFNAGGATSYEIEDLWTHGVMQVTNFGGGLVIVRELLALCGAVVSRAVDLGSPSAARAALMVDGLGADFNANVVKIRHALAWPA